MSTETDWSIRPPLGPFAMGFVVQHVGWNWMHWIMSMVCRLLSPVMLFLLTQPQLNLAHLVLYLFFGPETLYNRIPGNTAIEAKSVALKHQYLTVRRIIPKPLSFHDFTLPLVLLTDLRILLSIIAYIIVFNFVLVLMAVEIPVLFTIL